MTTERTYVLRTRSTQPFALIGYERGAADARGIRPIIGIFLIGYAASEGPRVVARARREGARIVPIVDGRVLVTVR